MTHAALSPRRLMQIQVETLFTLDERGRLLLVNEPDGKPAPRFFLGSTAEGNQCWFRHDVPEDVVRDLEAICRTVDPIDADRCPAVLQRHTPVTKTWAGPAYVFSPDVSSARDTIPITEANAGLLSRHLPDWCDAVRWQPMMASLADGHAVAVCGSVRLGRLAHEAGVETAAEFRRQGHASRVVTAWATAVRDLNRIPIYSTSWANVESRAVAAKLGLIQFGTDLHIT